MPDRHVQVGDARVDLLFGGVFEASRENLRHTGGEEKLATSLADLDDGALRLDVDGFLRRGPRGFGRAEREGGEFRIVPA